MNQIHRKTTAAGLRFNVRNDADAQVISEVVENESYERKKLGFTLRSGETWLDCGANIGAFSVWAEKMRSCKVVAYEACEENLEIGSANTKLNSCKTLWKLGFVSAKAQGVSSVSFNSETPARSSTSSRGKQRFVGNLSLSEEIRTHKPQGIKIDIEGAEFSILETRFPLDGIRAIAIEYHMRIDKDLRKCRSRIQWLRDAFPLANFRSQILEKDVWGGWQDTMLFFWRD